jgi:hypothetical protein
MNGVEKDLRDMGLVNWKTKAQERDGWRKYFRAGQDPQRFVVPVIMMIIATDCGLEGWGSLPGRSKRVFSSSQRQDRLCGPSSRL